MGVIVEYSSNNSGGEWWLSTEDWEALENAGWNVHWVDEKGHTRVSFHEKLLEPCEKIPGAEWLGAAATSCAKEFDDPTDAIPEWESVTGAHAGDYGCSCCGPPHNFAYTDEKGKYHYASGRIVETACEWD